MLIDSGTIPESQQVRQASNLLRDVSRIFHYLTLFRRLSVWRHFHVLFHPCTCSLLPRGSIIHAYSCTYSCCHTLSRFTLHATSGDAGDVGAGAAGMPFTGSVSCSATNYSGNAQNKENMWDYPTAYRPDGTGPGGLYGYTSHLFWRQQLMALRPARSTQSTLEFAFTRMARRVCRSLPLLERIHAC